MVYNHHSEKLGLDSPHPPLWKHLRDRSASFLISISWYSNILSNLTLHLSKFARADKHFSSKTMARTGEGMIWRLSSHGRELMQTEIQIRLPTRAAFRDIQREQREQRRWRGKRHLEKASLLLNRHLDQHFCGLHAVKCLAVWHAGFISTNEALFTLQFAINYKTGKNLCVILCFKHPCCVDLGGGS